MKNECVEKLERREMRMICQMCGVKVSDRRACAKLRERMGMEAITDVLREKYVWSCRTLGL